MGAYQQRQQGRSHVRYMPWSNNSSHAPPAGSAGPLLKNERHPFKAPTGIRVALPTVENRSHVGNLFWRKKEAGLGERLASADKCISLKYQSLEVQEDDPGAT